MNNKKTLLLEFIEKFKNTPIKIIDNKTNVIGTLDEKDAIGFLVLIPLSRYSQHQYYLFDIPLISKKLDDEKGFFHDRKIDLDWLKINNKEMYEYLMILALSSND